MKTSSGLVPGIGGAVCSPYCQLQVAPHVFLLLLALSPLALAQQVDRWRGPADAEPVVPWRVEAPAAKARPPLFAAPWMTYNTGVTSSAGSPIALATGDADGDGDIDVVAARAYAEGGFVYLRNDRTGSLAQPVSYAGTGKASGIVMVDLDNDGDLDVAVTDSDGTTTGNTVSVYLGNGNGTFGLRQPWSVGSGTVVPLGIAAGDFDADGDVDLAVAAHGYVGGGKTAVLLTNNGNATFAAPVAFTATASPSDIAAGDVNGDGRPDLIIAHELYTVSVLLNNGAGGFGAAVLYKNLGGTNAGPLFPTVALGDADKDGDLDIVYGN
ncbi:MAG: VCBS repeat-containing protein, partial [Chthoniobacterales bacterium]|nr:VCBS repeat-containing protein [Chthoniobacterales bacterium]